jgi:NAD(P)-dependent dehydrogenase (short-subunit alcohol dehydrogenase family)
MSDLSAGGIGLNGRVAIVTGAGRGLGRSHALALARRGAAVVVNDIGGLVDGTGTSDAAESVASEIRNAGGQAVTNNDSVASPAGAAAMVDAAVDNFGRLDIAVSNAGILRAGNYETSTEEDFRSLLDVHLGGSFWFTQAAYRVMKTSGYGRIVFTSSGSGLFGQPDSPGYCAAKAGMVGLMNCLALEGREHGILANSIAPIAYTRMTAAAFGPELEHQTRPELVSELVAYLSSEQCGLTQQIIEVGAGNYGRVFLGRCEGSTLDPSGNVEAEAIAAHLAEILDTSDFQIPGSTMEVLAGLFHTPFEYGGAQGR